ncbi:hypothetical protein BD626DRAFT_472163 [Schizophyllum amplum]|uniref:Uncharacterized protein n=1 Tax=Schizophyllum amplum TaxID=97359 RepID=A0A550CVP9_9AGAR|nr:hypothetical protein BD626DRAFT_472163 [Auriculariopsis ampla]
MPALSNAECSLDSGIGQGRLRTPPYACTDVRSRPSHTHPDGFEHDYGAPSQSRAHRP